MGRRVLLIVDLEPQYLADDYFFCKMMDFPPAEARARQEGMRSLYQAIADAARERQRQGWEIHFTGERGPDPVLRGVIDERLPYWFLSQDSIRRAYAPDDEVHLAGLYRELCVFAVHNLIPQSRVDLALTISCAMVGGDHAYYGEGAVLRLTDGTERHADKEGFIHLPVDEWGRPLAAIGCHR